MKKFAFALLAAAALTVAAAFPADAQQQLRWGAEVGAVVSRPFFGDFTARMGFELGVKGEYAFTSPAGGWYLAAALTLGSKPMKMNEELPYAGDGSDIDERPVWLKATPYFLSLPVQMGYRLPLRHGLALHLSTGPSVALGLFGDATVGFLHRSPSGESLTQESAKCFTSDSPFRRFNVGWNPSLGVDFCRRWQADFRYNVQLNSMFSNWFDDRYNQTFSLSLGYFF